MTISARLAELGLELPEVVPPVAAYVPAKVHGDLVYTAGQLPFVSGGLPATGKVGDGHGLVPASDAASYARQSALNAIAAAAAVVGGVDKLTGVLKVTGFVASVPEFTGQPASSTGRASCSARCSVRTAATRDPPSVFPSSRSTRLSRSRSSSLSPERTRERRGRCLCADPSSI